jgi:hypothetical protein
MERERKREQQRERFYAREERKRVKRHKISLPGVKLCHPSGANAAAVGYETQTAAAAKNPDSSRGGSAEPAVRGGRTLAGCFQGVQPEGTSRPPCAPTASLDLN